MDELYEFLGNEIFVFECYMLCEFYDFEMIYMWIKVWQMVCWEEEILKVGDYFVYEVGDIFVIVV